MRTRLLVLVLSLAVHSMADTPWFQQQRFTGANPFINDNFGSAVAVNGNTAVVTRLGAFGVSRAAAYVYVRAATGWSLQQILTPADPIETSYFGTTVSLSGDTLL